MSSTISRSRAAALKDTGPEAAELQSQLQTLEKDSLADEQSERIENVHARLEAGHRIRQSLLESQGTFHIKDTFRHLNGFQAVIATLDGVARKYGEFSCTIDEELTIIKSLIQAIFGVLTAALQSHKGNQKYFRQHVEGGGWLAVENQSQHNANWRKRQRGYWFESPNGQSIWLSVGLCSGGRIHDRLLQYSEATYGCYR